MTDKTYHRLVARTGYIKNSLIVLVPLLAGLVIGHEVGKFKMRRQAVRHGHAYYFVNTNHHKEWSWAAKSPEHHDTRPFPYVPRIN